MDNGNRCIRQGDLHRSELAALDLGIRRDIIDIIGLEPKSSGEIGEGIGLASSELNEHLSLLEEAMLIELEDGCYQATPRCVAYLYKKWGYEWRR